MSRSILAVEPKPRIDQLQIRWMLRCDFHRILEIEQECFGLNAWTEDDFIRCLRQKNAIGLVADVITNRADFVGGYVVYENHPTHSHIVNLAVAAGCRRQRIGARLVEKLVGKLSLNRRRRILLEVRETNLAAQLFFRAMGFRARDVLHDFYEDGSEDAYLMQYSLRQSSEGGGA